MQVTIQFYTKKGFYGPPIIKQVRTVVGAMSAVEDSFDEMPDKLEGESFLDWTNITVEVVR